ncbi:MAG: phenylalanine--tRNA ligase subunit alpha [Candidatus Micrarchaeia archaeon]
MHEYTAAVLEFLKSRKTVNFEELKALGISEDSVRRAIEELAEIEAVKVERQSKEYTELTDEGKKYLNAFPEELLMVELGREHSISVSEIKNQIGLIWAKKNNWITIAGGKVSISSDGLRYLADKSYNLRAALNAIAGGAPCDDNLRQILIRRGLASAKEKSIIKSVSITSKGMSIDPASDGISALTRDLIKSGKWRASRFKPYDINASAEPAYAARLHPLHEFIDSIRRIWLNMGFTEVSGPIIESAFWNFDALFAQQDHPSREMQDTFFLSNPKIIGIDDLEALARVKKMHTKAWKEKWSKQLAEQAVLRTQTTSVSAHYMRKFASVMDASYPVKLFSVGRVFRNESIDYKHLAELHQVDGIIIGDKLSIANLKDTLKRFYEQAGFPEVRFRPSYFPFVEPGMEVYYYDEHFGDNIELCGAGIIRKEITKAMGLDKTVLAWGGGIERLLMRHLSIENITELYGNDIGWLRRRKEVII